MSLHTARLSATQPPYRIRGRSRKQTEEIYVYEYALLESDGADVPMFAQPLA